MSHVYQTNEIAKLQSLIYVNKNNKLRAFLKMDKWFEDKHNGRLELKRYKLKNGNTSVWIAKPTSITSDGTNIEYDEIVMSNENVAKLLCDVNLSMELVDLKVYKS